MKGIGSWLTYHSERNPTKTAIVYKNERLTYAELNERVNRLANTLNQMGVRKGDRVNALLFNRPQLLETMFACAKIGAVFVPINYRLSASEVHYIVQDSGGIVFIYEERLQEVVVDLKQKDTPIQKYVRIDGELLAGEYHYEDLIDQGLAKESSLESELHEPHLMMYTSGTTGQPKGAILTQGNTLWNAINCISALPINEKTITLTVAPLFHIGGMSIFTTPVLYKGGTVVLEDVFKPETTLSLVEKEDVNTLFLVPAMWLAITQVSNLDQYDLSSLTYNISGGAPCPLTIIEFFKERNIPFFEGFGLTETAPVVSVLDSANSIRKSGSVGKPPIHVSMKVVDEYGRGVPTGKVGELIIKGPNIFKEYWNKPEATREALRDGWFYTGDLAKIDEEGFFYIVDRMKDMVITGGENVYPIEVEQVLFRHPNVREVAVVGYPDDKWGESVKAFIALKDSEKPLALEEVKSFCRGKIASFKIPKQVEIVNELPRNATGKVLKTMLRKNNVFSDGRE